MSKLAACYIFGERATLHAQYTRQKIDHNIKIPAREAI